MPKLMAEQQKLHDPNAILGDDYEVIMMPRCLGVHAYHQACLSQYMNSKGGEFLKCCVCEITYGLQTGTMPNGQMSW